MRNTRPADDDVIEARSAWHVRGDAEVDDMVAKSTLVHALDARIRKRRLSQTAAAPRLGIQRPNLARILSGRFRAVMVEQLFKLLAALGIEVRVSHATSTMGTATPGGITAQLHESRST